ncbi:MAG: hypothetical protein JNK48_34720 [Bryobacterales bacterium]|nr:hypothetical protein [Bryobacterales bacterium]
MAKQDVLDFSAFPPNTVTPFRRTLCLACVADVFTKLLGIPAKKTVTEMRGYTPALEELTGSELVRPYFLAADAKAHCPYCDSSTRKHSVLTTYCVEGGRATDAARRKLVAGLTSQGEGFAVLEAKSTHDEAFFTWLEKMAKLDSNDERWIRHVTQGFLERKHPRTDWDEVFEGIYMIRRSARLEEGWEVDARRLFLAPELYWETVAVQYIVSRSHHGGGQTFEGRLTLQELVSRLRHSGYLRAVGITMHSPGDVFEALMHHLAGGDGGVKMHYVVDRRDFLEKLKELRIAEPRKKAVAKKKVAAKKAATKKAATKKSDGKKAEVKKVTARKAVGKKKK